MTKGDIDRLGERIGASKVVTDTDLEQLQEYRQSFQDSLSRVFSFVLKTARKIDKQCIVTYRVKRIDTIIEKLRRFRENENGEMRLSRMWDIGGCRCILNVENYDKLYLLHDAIIKEFESGGAKCKVTDHIKEPSKSGYTSLHIYVKDKITQKPIEIQIRNKAQHNWATLVEIVDLLYESKNKESGDNSPLGHFLYLFSKAKDLSENDFAEMLRIERRMRVFERMSRVLTRNYLNIRLQWLKQKVGGCYFVITANRKKSEIVSYATFREAEAAYYEKYLANSDSNIVLTYLQHPDFEQISMAYSNYVLAMHAFFDDYRAILAERIIECVNNGQYRLFLRFFKIYNSDVRYHIENLSIEVKSIDACNKNHSVSKNQINKWMKEINHRLHLWYLETDMFLQKLLRAGDGNRINRWLVKNRIRSLLKAVKEGLSVLQN